MSKDNHEHNPECSHCQMLASGMTEEQVREASIQQIKEMIERSGIAIIGVSHDAENNVPAFFYTVGFTDIGMPEVILFGLPEKHALPAINRYFSEVKEGTRPSGPSLIDDYFNLPVQIINADAEISLGIASDTVAYYENQGKDLKPTFVQWVLSDKNGEFPWSENFEPHFYQPVIGLPPTEDQASDRVLH